MSNATASAETFASGRYSKRKRTQITYRMDELDVSDADSDIEKPHVKVQCTVNHSQAVDTNQLPKEAQGKDDIGAISQNTSQAQSLPIHGAPRRDP